MSETKTTSVWTDDENVELDAICDGRRSYFDANDVVRWADTTGELRYALYTAMDILFQGDDPSNERIELISSAAPDYEPGWQYRDEED